MADLDKLIAGDHDDPRAELDALFPEGAVEWGRDVIARAGLDGGDLLRVTRALRDAEPRLSLRPATWLAARLV
jgi:hypothetical protein